MDKVALYNQVCQACSTRTTRSYSTSFSLGIRFLAPQVRDAIYAIYGFVRFADEIVDSFHDQNQRELFDEFKRDTYLAMDRRFSMNPILQAFQVAYHEYNIDQEHVDLFLRSMEWDRDHQVYDRTGFEEYIVGSAEVVGLMCWRSKM